MPKTIQSQIFSPLAQSKPLAAHAGEFLFLSGQTPHDRENGRLVINLQDIKNGAKGFLALNDYGSLFDRVITGPIVAQTFTILANIKVILSENSMSMRHIVKSNIHLTEFQDLTAFYRIWKKFFPEPTTTCSVIGIPTLGMNHQIRVTIDCIAALPEKIFPEQIQRIPSNKPQIGLGQCSALKTEFVANFWFKVSIAMNFLLCLKFVDKAMNIFFSIMILAYFKKRA